MGSGGLIRAANGCWVVEFDGPGDRGSPGWTTCLLSNMGWHLRGVWGLLTLFVRLILWTSIVNFLKAPIYIITRIVTPLRKWLSKSWIYKSTSGTSTFNVTVLIFLRIEAPSVTSSLSFVVFVLSFIQQKKKKINNNRSLFKLHIEIQR